MCLTVEAFALFLNLVGASLVSSAGDIVTIHAREGDVDWVATGAIWCTDATVAPRVFVADGITL